MKLSVWLKNHEMTQHEFAELIGGCQSQVSRYCSGQAIPTREVMRMIIEVTRRRVLPDDFYNEEIDVTSALRRARTPKSTASA